MVEDLRNDRRSSVCVQARFENSTAAVFRRALMQGIWQGAILVVIAVVLALSVNALRPDGLPLVERPAARTIQPGVASTISLPGALKLYHAHTALFLDARDPYMFNQAHIPGALSVPPGKSALVMSQLTTDPGRMIITYCDGPECGRSEQLARELKDKGLPNVRIMTEGWYAWLNSGFPIEGNP